MVRVVQTGAFRRWFEGLRDRRAQKHILLRLGRLEGGHFGDVKPVGDGVSELRVQHGPGYRIYFTVRGSAVVLLLCGGDKDGQARDIERAKRLARDAT
jgi:putative addiction module killer protein